MKILAIIAIASSIAATPAHAATAYWTGRSVMAQSVTFQTGWKCEYQYAGQTFWLMFPSICPSSVEVQ